MRLPALAFLAALVSFAQPARGPARVDGAAANILRYLPADFPIYKPSQVHGAGPLPLGKGYAVVFSSPSPAAAIMAFYNRELPARKWNIKEQRITGLQAVRGANHIGISVASGARDRRFTISILRR